MPTTRSVRSARNAPDPGPRRRRVLQGPPAGCRRGQHPHWRRRGATNSPHRQGSPDRIRQLLGGSQEIWDGIRERSDAHRNSGRFGTRIRSWAEQLPLRAKCIREELAAERSVRHRPQPGACSVPGLPHPLVAKHPERVPPGREGEARPIDRHPRWEFGPRLREQLPLAWIESDPRELGLSSANGW